MLLLGKGKVAQNSLSAISGTLDSEWVCHLAGKERIFADGHFYRLMLAECVICSHVRLNSVSGSSVKDFLPFPEFQTASWCFWCIPFFFQLHLTPKLLLSIFSGGFFFPYESHKIVVLERSRCCLIVLVGF